MNSVISHLLISKTSLDFYCTTTDSFRSVFVSPQDSLEKSVCKSVSSCCASLRFSPSVDVEACRSGCSRGLWVKLFKPAVIEKLVIKDLLLFVRMEHGALRRRCRFDFVSHCWLFHLNKIFTVISV